MAIRGAFAIHKGAAVLGLCLFVLSPILSAQSFLGLKKPSIEAFGGYSYFRFNGSQLGYANSLNLNGGEFEISLPGFYRGLGLAIDTSGHYSSEMAEFNFLFGPQYTFGVGSFRVFAHGLIGKTRVRLLNAGNTQIGVSSFGDELAIGGGIDYPWKKKLWLRPIQADVLDTGAFGDRFHNIRISTGVIYRFGKP